MDVLEIVTKYGYTYAKITQMARKLNIYCEKGKKYNFTEAQSSQIIKLCEIAVRPPVKTSTKDVAKRLNRSITTIQLAGKAIGIVYRKAHPHDYTEEEIKRIESVLKELKYDRKKPVPEVTYRDKSWWVDPTPDSLKDDYEEEWDEV